MKSKIKLTSYTARCVHRNLQPQLQPTPKWHAAVSIYPPLAIPTTRATPVPMALAETYCSGLYTNKWIQLHRRGGKPWTRAVRQSGLRFPPDLVFAEDSVRHRFLGEHPLERLRGSVLGGGGGPGADALGVALMAGELKARQGMEEEKAYRSACEWYYSEVRKGNERHQQQQQTQQLEGELKEKKAEGALQSKTDAESKSAAKWLKAEEDALRTAARAKLEQAKLWQAKEQSRLTSTAL